MRAIYLVCTLALSLAFACKPKVETDASTKAIVGIDADGKSKAFGLMVVVNEPKAPMRAEAQNNYGVAYAEDLLRMPLFAFVECMEHGGLSPTQWYQYTLTRSYIGDVHLTSDRILTLTNDLGQRVPSPCQLIQSGRLASYAVVTRAFANVYANPNTYDDSNYLMAQSFFLALRGFYKPQERFDQSPLFSILIRMAQAEQNSAPPNYSSAATKFMELERDFNPCLPQQAGVGRLGARAQILARRNFTCADLGGGALYAYRPGGPNRSYAQIKKLITTEVQALHAAIYQPVTASSTPTDILWDLATSEENWLNVARTSLPQAPLARYLTAQAGGLNFVATFNNSVYAPREQARSHDIPRAFDLDAFLSAKIAPSVQQIKLPPKTAGFSLAQASGARPGGTRPPGGGGGQKPPGGGGGGGQKPPANNKPQQPSILSFSGMNGKAEDGLEALLKDNKTEGSVATPNTSTSTDRDFWKKLQKLEQDHIKTDLKLEAGKKVPGIEGLTFSGKTGDKQMRFSDEDGNSAIVSPRGVTTLHREGKDKFLVTSLPHEKDSSGKVVLGEVQLPKDPKDPKHREVEMHFKGDSGEPFTVKLDRDEKAKTLSWNKDTVHKFTEKFTETQGKLLDKAQEALKKEDCKTAAKLLSDATANEKLEQKIEDKATFQKSLSDSDKEKLNAIDKRREDLLAQFKKSKCGTALHLDGTDDLECDASGESIDSSSSSGANTGGAAQPGQGQEDLAAGGMPPVGGIVPPVPEVPSAAPVFDQLQQNAIPEAPKPAPAAAQQTPEADPTGLEE